ncbi:MAG: hypothetical protein Q4B84_00410 [Clostridia bacterium]|nr:hypothetical protein [Clostridia bacterium]
MSSSIIKLEDCQLDEISGGVTGKQVAKYAIKGTCKILGGAIAVPLIFCTVNIMGFKIKGEEIIKKDEVVGLSIWGGGLGAIGAVGAMIVDGLSGILCKKLNLED